MRYHSVGAALRAVRIRRGWRQDDVARRAGLSRASYSRAERGLIDGMTFGTLRSVADVLDIRLQIVPRWRGEELDRLLNAKHSAMHERIARLLSRHPGVDLIPRDQLFDLRRARRDRCRRVACRLANAAYHRIEDGGRRRPVGTGNVRPQAATGVGDRSPARLGSARDRLLAGHRRERNKSPQGRGAPDGLSDIAARWSRRDPPLDPAACRLDRCPLVSPIRS